MNYYVTRNSCDGYEIWYGEQPPEPCNECGFFKQDTETVVIMQFSQDEFEGMSDYELSAGTCHLLKFPLFLLEVSP